MLRLRLLISMFLVLLVSCQKSDLKCEFHRVEVEGEPACLSFDKRLQHQHANFISLDLDGPHVIVSGQKLYFVPSPEITETICKLEQLKVSDRLSVAHTKPSTYLVAEKGKLKKSNQERGEYLGALFCSNH